jgi:small multidrug resistance pump
MPALLLTLAILVEVVSTALLPRTEGFTRPGWSIAVASGYVCAAFLLSLVVRTMPISVAYAEWAGLGTALVAAVGVVFLSEPLGWLRAVSLGMVVMGVVGLNLTGAH